MKKTKTSYTKSRYREHLWTMLQKHQSQCSLCGKDWDYEKDLPARDVDQLTRHHIDGNHYNNSPDNWTLVHRLCHKSHHSKDNILFWRQFR